MKNIIGPVAALMLLALTTIVNSCKKEDNPTCPAGEGGNVEIVVFAKHNGATLINSAQHPDTAYLKFGTTASPGTNPSAYDKYYVSEAGEDHIHLTNLKCGSYFIYRTAFDTTVSPGIRYTGSLGLSFTQTSGEVDTTIIVN